MLFDLRGRGRRRTIQVIYLGLAVLMGGGLVLFGGAQGNLVALSAANGRELWHVGLGQDWQASPMTYMVGGRQYMVLPGPAGVFAFALPDSK